MKTPIMYFFARVLPVSRKIYAKINVIKNSARKSLRTYPMRINIQKADIF